jgi:hypothetical protein
METTLLVVGLGCVVAAIVGGGIKLQQLEIREFTSLWRQGLLGTFGAVLLLIVAWNNVVGGDDDDPTPTPVGPPTATAASPPTEPPVRTPGPSGEPSIALSVTTGPPGTSVIVSGSGFEPGETVTIHFAVDEVGRVQADGQGAFASVEVLVPSNWRFTGQTDFVAVGGSSARSARFPFDVTAG